MLWVLGKMILWLLVLAFIAVLIEYWYITLLVMVGCVAAAFYFMIILPEQQEKEERRKRAQKFVGLVPYHLSSKARERTEEEEKEDPRV